MSARKKPEETQRGSWYFRWQDWVFTALSRGLLSGNDVAVILVLAKYADYGTGQGARPGNDQLAKDTRLSVASVGRALSRGRALGLIHEDRRGRNTGGQGSASVYRMTTPTSLPEPEPTAQHRAFEDTDADPPTAQERAPEKASSETPIAHSIAHSTAHQGAPTEPTVRTEPVCTSRTAVGVSSESESSSDGEKVSGREQDVETERSEAQVRNARARAAGNREFDLNDEVATVPGRDDEDYIASLLARDPPPVEYQEPQLEEHEHDVPTGSLVPVANEPTDFDRFWSVYPLKVARQAAHRAWDEVVASTSAGAIITGATNYANDPNREPGFTAHPAKWLTDGRWDDDPLPARMNLKPTKPSKLDRMRETIAILDAAEEQQPPSALSTAPLALNAPPVEYQEPQLEQDDPEEPEPFPTGHTTPVEPKPDLPALTADERDALTDCGVTNPDRWLASFAQVPGIRDPLALVRECMGRGTLAALVNRAATADRPRTCSAGHSHTERDCPTCAPLPIDPHQQHETERAT